MWTVTQLARACGLSRSTVLYYESIGLLGRPKRTAANYRRYSADDAARLREICMYRDAGLKLSDIGAVLKRREGEARAVLRRRLGELDREIARLRSHQLSILKLLQVKPQGRFDMVSKEKFVAVMRAAGFTDQDMHRWHAEFERLAPAEHQEFLEFLGIGADEIAGIRQWSRTTPQA